MDEGWSEPFTVNTDSNLYQCKINCADCQEPFRLGDQAIFRYGPRGGAPFHEDCALEVRLDEEAGI